MTKKIDNLPIHLIQNFWSKIQIPDNLKDCWIWTAKAKSKDGYGVFRRKDIKIYSHRFSYELIFGKFPKELRVLHICDNPPCCNPLHLRLGTQKDNVRDCWAKGRHSHVGSRNTKAKLNEEEVLNIKIMLNEGVKSKIIYNIYGRNKLSKSMLANIKGNRNWKHIL